MAERTVQSVDRTRRTRRVLRTSASARGSGAIVTLILFALMSPYDLSSPPRRGPYNLEIVDHVILPATLEAGEYVVGFRWGKCKCAHVSLLSLCD